MNQFTPVSFVLEFITCQLKRVLAVVEAPGEAGWSRVSINLTGYCDVCSNVCSDTEFCFFTTHWVVCKRKQDLRVETLKLLLNVEECCKSWKLIFVFFVEVISAIKVLIN